MKSARHTLVPRLGTIVPTLALVATVTVGALTSQSDVENAPEPKAAPVAYVAGSPVGRVDSVVKVPGGVRATGWVYDPSAPSTRLNLSATVDHAFAVSGVAGVRRDDVAAAIPKAGNYHGFVMNVPAPEGNRITCITAYNVGAGQNLLIGCRTMLLDYGPIGSVDTVDTRPGAVHVRGWSADPDRPTAPVTTTVTIDGAVRSLVANRARNDVARVHPSLGTAHGFEGSFATTQGKHTVCVTARNIGYGSDNSLGCRTVTVNDNPLGQVDSVAQSGGRLVVKGWALDRDTPTTALGMNTRIDSGPVKVYAASVVRDDVARAYPGTGNRHGYVLSFAVPAGTHTVCVTARNVGFGTSRPYACTTITLNFAPSVTPSTLTATRTGVRTTGWAIDPDTTAPVSVRVTLDGTLRATVRSAGTGATHSGHNYNVALPTTSGTHTLCVTALNLVSGTRNSANVCRTTTIALKPFGLLDTVVRTGNNIRVGGWAFDPDSTTSRPVTLTVDGRTVATLPASATRADVVKVYPSAGRPGFAGVLTTTDAKHTVCATVQDARRTTTVSLGCKLVIAVHPVAPSAPRTVKAVPGYGSARITWVAPASDGGAPPSSYVVASSGGQKVRVGGTTFAATVAGLKSGTVYAFTVQAVNVAGGSPTTRSALVRTQSGPAPQTTPAPVSTSRYIRNIRTCSAPEAAELRKFGAGDAAKNPAGHRYMMLLDIGGQNQTYGGVVLSATTRFVTYANLLACSKAYVAGYVGAQRSGAPATIAIGVNNDMDVNATTGRDWATKIVNPLVSYARPYTGITIAGANDIEPGFSASYAATRNWVGGYLAATNAKFVFNGSADGCAWTVTNKNCNNGWTMAGLYNMAAGFAPSQILNLPQIYNYTMADQWKYISLTGIGVGKPRINFGGPLTEVTACAQARSCDSIGGASAWRRLWSNLQSHPKLKVGSLPYATDLRIDS